MEQSSSFCGRRTGTQRRKNKKILQGPQESFQAREVSRIYARTKSNRTVLEACQEIFVKQASENHACCKISFEKNFQKERLYAQNVPLFKRLAIRSGAFSQGLAEVLYAALHGRQQLLPQVKILHP